MKFLSKRLLFSSFFVVLISLTTTYAQSENDKINEIISQKKTFNQENENSIVYKIQLYNGNEVEAFKVKTEFEKEFPDYKTILKYKQPEWKTQVGNFKTRLEADRVLQIIKKKFGAAIVLEDKV